MRDHTVNCEMRIFVGSKNCTCGAVDEGEYGSTTNGMTDVDGRTAAQKAAEEGTTDSAPVEEAAVETTFTMTDNVMHVTTAKKPHIVVINGTVYTPLEMKQ